MTKLSNRIMNRLGDSGSLLGALDAITNWRAFALLAVTYIAFAVSIFLAVKSASMGIIISLLLGLIGLVVLLVGGNATGIILMDEAAGRNPRSPLDALLASLFSVHRLGAVALVELILFIVYLIVLAIVLLLCKIPGVGPLLYAFIFPLAAILTGTIIFALIYVALPLAAPAVWNGGTVMQVIAMLGAVARSRLVYVVIMELLLGLLLFVMSGIIALILIGGIGTTLMLSAAVVGPDAASGGLTGMMSNLMGGMGSMRGMDGGGAGYLAALGFGGIILFLCGALPPVLMAMKGSAVIYLNAIDGLAIAEAETEMKKKMDELKSRAQDASERAQQKMSTTAATVLPAAPIPAVKSVLACPACKSTVNADDVFCGDCGHKLN